MKRNSKNLVFENENVVAHAPRARRNLQIKIYMIGSNVSILENLKSSKSLHPT